MRPHVVISIAPGPSLVGVIGLRSKVSCGGTWRRSCVGHRGGILSLLPGVVERSSSLGDRGQVRWRGRGSRRDPGGRRGAPLDRRAGPASRSPRRTAQWQRRFQHERLRDRAPSPDRAGAARSEPPSSARSLGRSAPAMAESGGRDVERARRFLDDASRRAASVQPAMNGTLTPPSKCVNLAPRSGPSSRAPVTAAQPLSDRKTREGVRRSTPDSPEGFHNVVSPTPSSSGAHHRGEDAGRLVGDLREPVVVPVRDLQRRVRSVVGDVQEEWPVAMATDEIHRLAGERLGQVHRLLDRLTLAQDRIGGLARAPAPERHKRRRSKLDARVPFSG